MFVNVHCHHICSGHVHSASPQATTTEDTADLGVSKGHAIFRYLFQFVAVLCVQIYIVFEAYYSLNQLTLKENHTKSLILFGSHLETV